MKYTVKFSCGHEEEVQLYGKVEERENKIKYLSKNGICSECYKKKMNEENAKNCEEVKMSYREYKNSYSDCKTKSGSYDKEEKTIIVYVPIKEVEEETKEAEEEIKDSREVFAEVSQEIMKRETIGFEEVTPAMIANELERMGYNVEKIKGMKDVPRNVIKDVLEKKEKWTN